MKDTEQTYIDAVKIAKLYYYQGLTTESIAQQFNFSRPKVSRLLSFARQQGLVEVRVVSRQEYLNPLARQMKERYAVGEVEIVPVPPSTGEDVWLERVAVFSASYLNSLIEDGMVVGLAWGTTISAVSKHLVPKAVHDVDVVQLNGSGNTYTINNSYAGEILTRFAENYNARAHLFPVPTFFDYAETKRAMWRERSIQRILDLQQRADTLIISIGAVHAGVPSHVYSGGYLEDRDLEELEREGVVGDFATVFFRDDGSSDGISINERASGPLLELYRKARNTLCIVSGRAKVRGLKAALNAGLLSRLIVDEPTARLVLADD